MAHQLILRYVIKLARRLVSRFEPGSIFLANLNEVARWLVSQFQPGSYIIQVACRLVS